MRLPAILALCSALLAADPVTGYPTRDGALVLSDGAGPLLELTPVAWGPNWGWVGWKSEIRDDGGATLASLAATLGPDKTPITLQVRAARSGPRQLSVTATFAAARAGACTLVVLGVKPGERYHGAGMAAVGAGGAAQARDVPFGRDPLGSAVTTLRLGADAAATGLTFAAPAEIQADGQGRLILAAGAFQPGERSVSFTVDLPGDLTWYPTPAATPDPPGFERWFAWQPQHALDDQGALGMRDWLDPIVAPVRADGDALRAGGGPVRMWGLNVCYASCAPPQALAERRAKLYAKYGFNAVRLHKYADGPGWAGIQSRESFAAFDPAGLERMDYFVAKLKEQGIRIKLSPTFGIQLGAGDRAAVPWMDELGRLDPQRADGRVRAAHGCVWFSRELQDLQIRQTVELLRHRNPHTGLTYAEDPAVLVVEFYNEDSALFYGTMERLRKVPTLRRYAAEAFSDWLARRYRDEAGLLAAWGEGALNSFAAEGIAGESLAQRSIVPAGNPWFYDPDQLAGSQRAKARRLHDTMLFLAEVQQGFWTRFAAAVREAGYRGEVLASNWHAGRAFSHFYNLHSDAQVGMVDRHNYFGGRGSMLASAGSGMLSSGLCQVAGRPFSLSEWIHTRPNEYGAEGPAIIGAYGMGLQGWDVSFMFENGDDGAFRPVLGKEEWDVMAPHILGLQPLVARQVLRGDVAPAQQVAALRVHVPSLQQGRLGFADQAAAQGDVKTADSSAVPARALAVARCQVEFTDTPEPTPVFDLAPFATDGALVSSTGQLRWYEGTAAASGSFTIDSPATKAVVGFAQGRRFELGGWSIASNTPFAAIYVTAAGRDDRDLATAPRILIGAVARARNTGMKLLDGRILEAGTSPVLMEPVQAEIGVPGGRSLALRALDHDGRRSGEPRPVRGGTVAIDAAADRTIYWELSAE